MKKSDCEKVLVLVLVLALVTLDLNHRYFQFCDSANFGSYIGLTKS